MSALATLGPSTQRVPIRSTALLGFFDRGKEDRLLPVWGTRPSNPRMSGSNRTSENGGKACGSQCKAIVPSHAVRIHRKEKCAMRKIILANIYAMRILMPL